MPCYTEDERQKVEVPEVTYLDIFEQLLLFQDRLESVEDRLDALEDVVYLGDSQDPLQGPSDVDQEGFIIDHRIDPSLLMTSPVDPNVSAVFDYIQAILKEVDRQITK